MMLQDHPLLSVIINSTLFQILICVKESCNSALGYSKSYSQSLLPFLQAFILSKLAQALACTVWRGSKVNKNLAPHVLSLVRQTLVANVPLPSRLECLRFSWLPLVYFFLAVLSVDRRHYRYHWHAVYAFFC